MTFIKHISQISTYEACSRGSPEGCRPAGAAAGAASGDAAEVSDGPCPPGAVTTHEHADWAECCTPLPAPLQISACGGALVGSWGRSGRVPGAAPLQEESGTHENL